MVTILKTYVFDGIEYDAALEKEATLLEKAEIAMESIIGTPIVRVVKNRRGKRTDNQVYDEIFDLINKSGNYEVAYDCQTFQFVKVKKGESN